MLDSNIHITSLFTKLPSGNSTTFSLLSYSDLCLLAEQSWLIIPIFQPALPYLFKWTCPSNSTQRVTFYYKVKLWEVSLFSRNLACLGDMRCMDPIQICCNVNIINRAMLLKICTEFRCSKPFYNIVFIFNCEIEILSLFSSYFITS